MIFNVKIFEKRFLEDCLMITFIPEPEEYSRYRSHCFYIYDYENVDVDFLIEERKNEIKIHFYNDLSEEFPKFATKYTL